MSRMPMAAHDALQPLEALERERDLRADDGGPSRRARRKEDRDDRRDISEGPSNGDQHGREKRGRGRLTGRTKGGMNTKLHAVCDSQGRPIGLFVTAGQVSDYIGARALLSGLQNVKWLLGVAAMTPTGSGKRCKTKGYAAASRSEGSERPRSNTTSPDKSGATASRSCSEGSRAGGAWQPTMTAVPRYSSRPSTSPLSSSIGYES